MSPEVVLVNVSWQIVQCSGLYPMIVLSHLWHVHCMIAPIFHYKTSCSAILAPCESWGYNYIGQVFLGDSRLIVCDWVLSGTQGEQASDVDAGHIPVELRGFLTGEWLPLVMAEHGAIGGDERVGA